MATNKNEECFIAILKSEPIPLKTEEILEKTELYPNLCSGCKSGNDVILAGQKLLKKGVIKREIGKGGFRWSLVT